MIRRARLGASGLLVQSDPNAEGFYAVHGGEVVERIPSSIAGRSLPLLHLACWKRARPKALRVGARGTREPFLLRHLVHAIDERR